MEEVHHTKICHQASDLMAARVLVFTDVGAEVSYPYRILVLKACQGLLQVWQVLQSGGKEVCADDQGLFYFSYDLSTHHVCPMEACHLYLPDLGLVSDNPAHSPLRAVRCHLAHRWSHHVVSKPSSTISLVGIIGIRKYHQVEA